MRCPVCQAENGQGPQCRRCRADLAMLFSVEEERARLLAAARACARHNQGKQLLALVDRIETLRCDRQSQRWRALGHLLNHDFARAFQTYRSSTPCTLTTTEPQSWPGGCAKD